MVAETIKLFIDNDRQMKQSFKWENHLIRKFGAFQLALNNQTVDVKQVKEMKEYMKMQTSSFSYFRSTNLFPIATALTSNEKPQQYFDQTVYYYEELKKEGFKRSVYLPYAAYFLATQLQPSEVPKTIEKAQQCYQMMKENHYWLTSDDDYMLAIILAYSHDDIAAAVEEMEACYSYLNERGISKGNALQTMSHLLTLSSERISQKCDRLLHYASELKKNKIKLDSYSQPILALLAMIDSNSEEVIRVIVETDQELASQDGFGNWSLGRASRNMFSVALVSYCSIQNSSQSAIKAAVQNSIQSVLLAQQVVMVSAIAASTAASNSSSS
ncbi:DUF4003 family protein [Bacillus massiliigorillae]|uniref:DUF4003 family protein n=1 Tax=Bacillus massiliigorillae TaxID=1243664 RepID=UPI0003AA08C2|nr:DUF4003 family protein [Bacillus massiliigorillae]